MNTNRELEKLTQDWLEDRVATPRLDGLRAVLEQTATTPQTRARFLGRWFDRGRGARRRTTDHDHPPDSDRRSRLMYSALAVTAAIAFTAVTVNVIDTTPTQPSAGAGATHIVAADASGDFNTIAEAVAAAAEGDTVLVRPGSYVEAFIIDKDIVLAGDGPREEIVISAPDGGPKTVYVAPGVLEFAPAYTLVIKEAQAVVRGLSFAGSSAAVVVDGGSPTLTDLAFEETGYGLLIHSGSTATLTDSTLIGGSIEFADSEPRVEGNTLRDGAYISGGGGGVVRDNALSGGGGISVQGTPLIEGNTVTGASSAGIASSPMEGDAGAPVIVDNTVSGSRFGIQVGSGWDYDPSAAADTSGTRAVPTIHGNDVSAELNAISVSETDAVVSGNKVHDSWNGIVLWGAGTAEVMGNDVQVDGVGIDIGVDASPSVDGNNACGGITSIQIHDTATPSMGENTTCDAA